MNHSGQLARRIADRIRDVNTVGEVRAQVSGEKQVGCISFRDYMAMCLYDPDYGYYRAGSVRIGKSGDFYTSSSVGSVMGEKIASYAAELISTYEGPVDAAEWGAGTGKMSAQILAAWHKLDCGWLPRMTYAVIDSSPVHLQEARATLSSGPDGPELLFLKPEEVDSSKLGGDNPLIIVANELLDAFPVHRVIRQDGQLYELGVALQHSDTTETPDFQYAYMALSDPEIERSLAADGIALLEGQETEVNLEAERWLAYAGGLVTRGSLMLIDYGHEARELTAPHRMRGSLLCYNGHRAHDNPFLQPGEQDITAHINFTACRRAAEASGWNVAYYNTQKQFLVDQGILGDLMAHDGSDPFSEAAKRNRSIRQLLLSDGMSETFKVMILSKG
ncbi:class I SAM-dependent methyltransferase [Paenibacillus mendelii]|uniref:Class I SAM-dependent methyltransferase n=1 Tax=Paenibacillus mendelii TaxID=206163 RepID=A0ABV6JHX3_9BACL|nr:SAM-dependent methyltransferase [Paenibacillus mendelii]MCQ6558284.1 SAM-dependent methyltransferase [Paenibacillus mendelii]